MTVGGDYRNRLGRPQAFTVDIVGMDGKKIPQPDAGPTMGGLVSTVEIAAKREYVFRLFLPDWAMFQTPGR